MKKIQKKFKEYLAKIINSKISHLECAEFINFSKNLIIPYLLHTKMSFLKLSSNNGLDVNDIAIDILGEVFKRDSKGCFINLSNFVSKLYEDLDTINDDNIFIAYQSFLRKISDTQIAKLYAQLDPTGFKIQRNIKESLPTKNLGLRKNIMGMMIYVLNDNNSDLLPYISIEKFEREFFAKVSRNYSTKELLNIIYTILIEETKFRKEISLTDTVYLFKKYYNSLETSVETDEEILNLPSESLFEKCELDCLYVEVINKIKSKIFIDYYSKGKLSIEQSKSLFNTINDIAYDLVYTGQNNTSYYNYLSKYINTNQEEYAFKFKSKLEYLVKILKEDLKNYFYAKE